MIEIGYDASRLPLGKLSKEHINKVNHHHTPHTRQRQAQCTNCQPAVRAPLSRWSPLACMPSTDVHWSGPYISPSWLRCCCQGYAVLRELSDELGAGGGSRSRLVELSNHFFSLIPHNFGRTVPPVIDSMVKLKAKLDMVEVSQSTQLHTQPHPPPYTPSAAAVANCVSTAHRLTRHLTAGDRRARCSHWVTLRSR